MAQDRSSVPPPARPVAVRRPAFDGYYAGLWTPVSDGSCAPLHPVRRDMLVDGSSATSGVNYPLRGFVGADGYALLTYGKASLAGRFGPDGFVGRADTGRGCTWQVTLARQSDIGGAVGQTPPPGSSIVPGEVPAAAVDAVLRPEHGLAQ